jgi:general secretion pathway protein J
MTMADRRSKGFTLIEVLISMAITMLILAGAFLTFSNLISGLEVLRRASGTTHSLNRMWMFVSRDVRQFAYRPVRNEFGEQESALWGGELDNDSLNLTRTGWHNGRLQPRGNLERVRYVLDEGVLYRESYAVLDRTDRNEPRRVALLDDVNRFEIRFLDRQTTLQPGAEWELEKWPASWGTNSRESGLVAPPLALAITLDIEGLGEITRFYEVPGV